jgi:uncharacterized coiled-coil protein SlyX
MDYGNAAQLGSFLISLLTFFFVVATYRSKAASDRVSSIETKVRTLEVQATRIEGLVEHLPDQDALHRMELTFEKMQGSMNVMAEKLKAVAAIADRLQEFLVSQSEPAKPPRRRSGS